MKSYFSCLGEICKANTQGGNVSLKQELCLWLFLFFSWPDNVGHCQKNWQVSVKLGDSLSGNDANVDGIFGRDRLNRSDRRRVWRACDSVVFLSAAIRLMHFTLKHWGLGMSRNGMFVTTIFALLVSLGFSTAYGGLADAGRVLSHQRITAWDDLAGDFDGAYNGRFGRAVANLGDLDGDGVADLAVGANLYKTPDSQWVYGAVFVVFLNNDGTVKSYQKITSEVGGWDHTLDTGDSFGIALATLGDIDGDGVVDLAVGAFGDDDGSSGWNDRAGAVYILFLNSDGTVKSHQKISDAQGGLEGALHSTGMFGTSLATLGDVDGDNVPDLAVGAAPSGSSGILGKDSVWVLLLNSDGTVKSHQRISSGEGGFTGVYAPDDYFGVAVGGLGDLDGDGVVDLAVGAPKDEDGGGDQGAVWVLFLNTDGTVRDYQKISALYGGLTGPLMYAEMFGSSLGSLGDFDGDGVVDLAVGAILSRDDPNVHSGGKVWMLLLNDDGTVKMDRKINTPENGFTGSMSPQARFGSGVTSMGDLNGDGAVDLAVGAPTDDYGGTVWTLFLDSGLRSISGRVTADCPDPETGLLGVQVDVFADGAGDLVGNAVTDENGNYQIDDLESGDHTVTIVTPLGYSVVEEEIPVTLSPGVATVDFSVSCIEITPSQRSIGFWKHQVGVALGGRGHAHIEGPILCDYLDIIEDHFNSNEINQVVIYEPPASEDCDEKLEVAKTLLNLKGNVGMTARAQQQLMALLLNVAGEKLSLMEVISDDGATVSQAITYCDNLIDDLEGDHELAKTIADKINNARMVPADMIPLDTDQIAYRRGEGSNTPGKVLLSQNYPNPFNPATRIAFSLSEAHSVELAVFGVDGRRVVTLVDETMPAGQYEVIWTGVNDAGQRVGSGAYVYRLTAGQFSETRRMTLIK